MSITTSQADSIRAAFAQDACCNRPTTHDLFNRVLRLSGAIVIKAAITHISDDVFIARLWLRVQGEEMSVDSRPSDAIALALRSKAPLFLNTNLLKQWNIDVDVIEREARHGLCERVLYEDKLKTSRSLRDELRHKPEHIRLAILKMRLDLAVRTQRFGEAAELKKMIDQICPIDRLTEQLKKAVLEQRFLDAAGIQDRITVWRARLRMWEKGALDLDDWQQQQQNGEHV
ncbi:hypothetical protein BWQ96_05468 [Gracilariopsis chorda]|uniref:BFN domain-containing protein n=1 Tax=Gracilariopsis chorda TaxID=448386 RepID=A0A2V3IRQ9_9FLOR|nr:hypothetical protein BWQ96_05468 [Gracilariopsis chorda]|eukprot:PXF44798.1 hypothetical protein BWQ96_05468 [Gracilariopsis chorda]